MFNGKYLSVLSGPTTERKDRSSLAPMIALSIGPNEVSILENSSFTKVLDLGPGEDTILVDNADRTNTGVFVRIMLVDWAITFELGGLCMDKGASLSPPISSLGRIFYVGDSISCGLNDSHRTRGCLDAFPYVAQRLLAREAPRMILDVDLISYPGWTLISPTEEEKKLGYPLGMEDKLFQVSPWDTDPYQNEWATASGIVIELGTNDAQYYSTERFGTSLRNLIARLLGTAASTPCFVWLIPPFPEDGEDNTLQHEFKHLVPSLQNTFGDHATIALCDIANDVDTTDGLHPSLAGHEALGLRMAKFIKAQLASYPKTPSTPTILT